MLLSDIKTHVGPTGVASGIAALYRLPPSDRRSFSPQSFRTGALAYQKYAYRGHHWTTFNLLSALDVIPGYGLYYESRIISLSRAVLTGSPVIMDLYKGGYHPLCPMSPHTPSSNIWTQSCLNHPKKPRPLATTLPKILPALRPCIPEPYREGV